MDVVVVVVVSCTKSSSSRCYYDALIMCNVCKESTLICSRELIEKYLRAITPNFEDTKKNMPHVV